MKTIYTAAIATLALTACSPNAQSKGEDPSSPRNTAEVTRPSDATSEAYMRQAEEDWAELAVRKIPGLLERILADDYVGVSSENDVRDKAKQINLANKGPSGNFASSKLDYVHYRHFGDTVLAQGQESVARKDGKPDLRLIWTDVWMFRKGKWQVVASQDSKLPEMK